MDDPEDSGSLASLPRLCMSHHSRLLYIPMYSSCRTYLLWRTTVVFLVLFVQLSKYILVSDDLQSHSKKTWNSPSAPSSLASTSTGKSFSLPRTCFASFFLHRQLPVNFQGCVQVSYAVKHPFPASFSKCITCLSSSTTPNNLLHGIVIISLLISLLPWTVQKTEMLFYIVKFQITVSRKWQTHRRDLLIEWING